MPEPREPSDREILNRTGRTFALSLRLVPGGMREPATVAYLLARAADTIADRDRLPEAERRRGLIELLDALEQGGPAPAPPVVPGPAPTATTAAEDALVGGLEQLLERWCALDPGDRSDVRDVVGRLVRTMLAELEQFPPGNRLAALPDRRALDAYTEGIAGCVGPFWTRLAARHAPGIAPGQVGWFNRAGRRYGRGLQLVNVLRDLPRDLRRGKCFLPLDELGAAGLVPRDLLEPAALARVAPVLARWERRARAGLLAGIAYAVRLPEAPVGLRIATALPARLGLLTLERLARSDARLDPFVTVRVPRREVYRTVATVAVRSLTRDGLRSLVTRRPT